jgi:acyl-CoA dehydrogenase
VRGGTTEILRTVAARGLATIAMGDRPETLLEESMSRLLHDRCTPEVVRAAEADGWAPQLWAAYAEAGFPWISVPEEAGGSGGSVEEACAALRLIGRHAAPIPVAETGLLGGWLLASAGLEIPAGPVTVGVGRPSDSLVLQRHNGGVSLTGALTRVPWARRAERIVSFAELDGRRMVVSIDRETAEVVPRRNLAGEPRDDVILDDVMLGEGDIADAPDGIDEQALRRRGALARTALMAGALERTAELTRVHAAEREQFGRPIASFQAVQQHVVVVASHAACAHLASRISATALDETGHLGVGAAKIVAGEAATVVSTRAHQVHGAIGMTKEHVLPDFTRRLWSWREEFGSELYWSHVIGASVLQSGAMSLWPTITSTRYSS